MVSNEVAVIELQGWRQLTEIHLFIDEAVLNHEHGHHHAVGVEKIEGKVWRLNHFLVEQPP